MFQFFQKQQIRFNCEDLHRRIFIFFVFAEPLINNYLEAKINYYRAKGINSGKYHESFIQLNKMHDILVKKQDNQRIYHKIFLFYFYHRNQYIPSEEHPINIEIYEKETCDEEDEDEEIINDNRNYQGQYIQHQTQTINQRLLKKKSQKKNKNIQLKRLEQQLVQGQYDLNGQIGQQEDIHEQYYGSGDNLNGLENPEVKKKKKKKKKNKGIQNKEDELCTAQQNAEFELNGNSSAEKTKKTEVKKKVSTCGMSEELEQFQRRLQDSFKNLKENQKIQPIISESWIVKVKEKYAKHKVKLNI